MGDRNPRNDKMEFDLFLGIVPEFRPGPCDKSLEGFEGMPFLRNLRLPVFDEVLEARGHSPPTRMYELKDGKLAVINLRLINVEEYAKENNGPEMEQGTNSGTYYF